MEDFTGLPKSNKEAKLLGSRYFFTGKPCVHGHADKRISPGGNCRTCYNKAAAPGKKRAVDRKRANHRQYSLDEVKKKTYPKNAWVGKYKKAAQDPARLQRMKAKDIVKRAIYAGKLTRNPCEVCGTEIVQGHHEDYSKPLEVHWLCSQHHQDRHRELRALEKAKLHNTQFQSYAQI